MRVLQIFSHVLASISLVVLHVAVTPVIKGFMTGVNAKVWGVR